jgi:hypothetical protein
MVALAVSVASALTTAPAAQGQAPAHEDVGLPTTPPPLEHSEAVDESGAPVQPSGSPGLAVVSALLAPLGLALGGLVTAASLNTFEGPRRHPFASAVVRSRQTVPTQP